MRLNDAIGEGYFSMWTRVKCCMKTAVQLQWNIAAVQVFWAF